MDEEYKIVGYHGTNKKDAKKIVKEQKFIPGKDEDNEDFLGRGIYFFLNNEYTVLWNLKKAKDDGEIHLNYIQYITRFASVSADIVINRKNLLDLENISDIVKYDKICKRFEKEFEEDEEYTNAKHKNRAIINYLYKIGYMDGIFAIRKIMKQSARTSYLNVVSDIEREIICVKNDIIISNMNLVKDIKKNTYNTIKYISFY